MTDLTFDILFSMYEQKLLIISKTSNIMRVLKQIIQVTFAKKKEQLQKRFRRMFQYPTSLTIFSGQF